MKDYLETKIKYQKGYVRLIKKTNRHAMFALVTTAILGIVCYEMNLMYAVGTMTMAVIYILFFLAENLLDIKHEKDILNLYESFEWRQELDEATAMMMREKERYETMIKRESPQ